VCVREEEAAGTARKHRYREFRAIADCTWDRARDGGKILQMRKSYGAFKSVDDLLAIRGLGPKRLEKMRKYLTVGKTTKAPPQPSPSAFSQPGGRVLPR